MSEQNRAPRWEECGEYVMRLVRAELVKQTQLRGLTELALEPHRPSLRRAENEALLAETHARIAILDAALARLAEPVRSAEGATAAEQLMREVCEALGWQGGTRDGALAAIRQAKRAADAAEAYDRELNETGGAGPAALIRESAAWRRVR